MKDFDFDELDRAVNSALSGTSSSNPQTPSNDNSKSELTGETVVNLDGAATKKALVEPVKPVTESASTAPVSVPSTPASSTPSTTPLATRRSTGRFMDMVHSSSDMRSNARPASAQPVQSQPPVPDTTDGNVQEGEDKAEAVLPPTTPLESPFLPDAKVEKRPLGGPVLLEEPNEPRLEAPDEPRIEATAELPDPIDFHTAQQEAVNEGVPEKVEEEEITSEELKPLDTSEKAPESVPELNTDTTPETAMGDIAAQKIDAELIDIDATVEPETYGPTSITQQYKEQPSSMAEPGAIFDTESYHQPLSPATKKKSGVWVIVLIILLVLLGAGLGAAFYLYVLPML